MRKRSNAVCVISLHAVLFLSVLLSGCAGEEEARQYAAQLAAILTSYQQHVDAQIKAQTEAYDDLFSELDNAALKDQRGQSESERARRTVELADRLLSASEQEYARFTRTRFRETLDAFAEEEFAKNRDIVTRDLESYRRFLAGTQELRQQAAEISQLEKQFTDLSKKAGPLDEIQRLAAFRGEVKSRLDKLICDESKTEQKDLQDNIVAANKKLNDSATPDSEKLLLAADKARAEAALSQVKSRLAGCSK
jgi:hypothetical protein